MKDKLDSPQPDPRDPASLNEFVLAVVRQFKAEMETHRRTTNNWSDARGAELVTSAMDDLLARLASIEIWGEANRVASSVLWDEASQILSSGSLQHRARTKPRGYAGDYLMLHRISEDWRCDDGLGRLFDHYFQSQHAPCAVRERCNLIAEIVSSEYARWTSANSAATPSSFHVVSIGSGPASELSLAASHLSSKASQLRVTLIDIDPDALEFARDSISQHLADTQIDCVRENLFRLPKRKAVIAEPAQVVYCAGLFDYLDDSAATAMLKMMLDWLAPSGRLLAFNFLAGNPTRAYMEWIGNWYLRYRTLAEMEHLAAAASLISHGAAVEAERTGVNAYIDARKKS